MDWLKLHIVRANYQIIPSAGRALHHERFGIVVDAVRKLV